MIDVISAFLHLDQYLGSAIADYGIWIYLVLFVIIFIETGVVLAPFLPGDSLIFLAGTFAAIGALDFTTLFIVMASAAILGDSANYYIGRRMGKRALRGEIPYVKKDHIDRTHQFYEKHGNKAIVMARFLPVARTFAPFIAGVACMKYANFLFYNVLGGLAWVLSFLTLGYFLGNVPVVKENI